MSFHISKIHFDIFKKILQQHLSRSRDILSFTNQNILSEFLKPYNVPSNQILSLATAETRQC